jgi:predicted RNase H-like nuclease (RuvC/YqgF family)
MSPEAQMVEKKKAKKPQDIVPLMLRLREALRQRLARDAEKAAKSLNAEIVDRLEASYTKDERIEELRERLDEFRRNVEVSKAEFKASQTEYEREVADLRQEFQKFRTDAAAEYASLQVEFEREASRLEAADAVFNALVGEDTAAREAVRGMALLLATNPGWAASAAGIQKMVQAAGTAIANAANKGVALTGGVSAILPASEGSSVSNTIVASGYVSTSDEAANFLQGEKNEGPRSRAR